MFHTWHEHCECRKEQGDVGRPQGTDAKAHQTEQTMVGSGTPCATLQACDQGPHDLLSHSRTVPCSAEEGKRLGSLAGALVYPFPLQWRVPAVPGAADKGCGDATPSVALMLSPRGGALDPWPQTLL